MLSSVVLGAGQARFASEYDEMTEASMDVKRASQVEDQRKLKIDSLFNNPAFIENTFKFSKKSRCSTEKCLINRIMELANRKTFRQGMDSLTCVGDPYSNHGVKCLPIEGLFIGK